MVVSFVAFRFRLSVQYLADGEVNRRRPDADPSPPRLSSWFRARVRDRQ